MKSLDSLRNEYNAFKALGLKLDMARGKPSSDQLDTVEGLLSVLKTSEQCIVDGVDYRNYGILDGIPAAKKLFSQILCTPEDQIIVGGNSSLNMMHDAVSRAMIRGVTEGSKPWSKYDKVSFLCPVPGYDRHFSICEYFGINMINIPLGEDGPDMDLVERLIAEDDTVKGMWCVPKYSNPTGITYSEATLKRFAALKPKAEDFRVFWDNAYVIHDLCDGGDFLANILELAAEQGNEDLFYVFTSTSKVSFPGAGMACMAASKANVARIKADLSFQTIGYDKLNQLRHTLFYPDLESVKKQMHIHLEHIKPKFVLVLDAFEKELSGIEGVSWTKPKGGYFINLKVPNGTAKRIVSLAKEAGLVLTGAGASFPYGVDPEDANLRIAPTYPAFEELEKAVDVLCCCVKLAAAEKEA